MRNASRDVDAYRVTLYGSLAATGKGHLTDVAILSVLEPAAPTRIVWEPEVVLPFHPNGMLFEGTERRRRSSTAGPFTASAAGALANEASRLETPAEHLYPLSTISEIKEWCYHEGKTYLGVCERLRRSRNLGLPRHGSGTTMCATIQRGLNNDGVLPGGLKVARKALDLLGQVEELHRLAELLAGQNLRLRAGHLRGKRLGRHRS